jgi:hypothetical protein
MQGGSQVFTLSTCNRIEFEKDINDFLKDGFDILSTCCGVVGRPDSGFEVMYGAIVKGKALEELEKGER